MAGTLVSPGGTAQMPLRLPHPDAHDLGLPVVGARLDEVKVGPPPPLQPPGPTFAQQVIMIAAAAVSYIATKGRASGDNSDMYKAHCHTDEGSPSV